MSAWVWIACAVIGSLGALLRAEIVTAAARVAGITFPWGTLAVNLSGAFALGLLHGSGVAGKALVVFGGALLGAFTTFSTWMLETVRLARSSPAVAAANLAVPLTLGLLLVLLGDRLGSTL
jgi:CrcB protein